MIAKIPSLSSDRVIRALARDGWRKIRQKGSHVRLEKMVEGKMKHLTIPAHNPIKKPLLAGVLKHAVISLERFLGELL